MPGPLRRGLGIGPSLCQDPQSGGALDRIGHGENTVRQRIGVRGRFHEVEHPGLAGALGQHSGQRVAIEIRQGPPGCLEKELMKIPATAIRLRKRRGGPGQGLLRLSGRPEFDHAKPESFRPAFLERADFLHGQVDSIFAEKDFLYFQWITHQGELIDAHPEFFLLLPSLFQRGLVVGRSLGLCRQG